jgi:hypothetical protein
MKKNIIIGLLAMTTLLFFVFGYLQKLEADRIAIQAEQWKVETEKYRKESEIHRISGEFHQRQAMKLKAELETVSIELERLKNRK